MMFIPPHLSLAILVLAVISIVALALIVIRQNMRSATHRIFFALSLVTASWLVLTHLSALPDFLTYYLLTARLTIFCAVPQSVLFFLLAHTLPSENLVLSHHRFRLLIVATIGVMFLTLTPLVFSSAVITGGRGTLAVGFGMPVFVAFVSILSIAALVTLIKKIHHSAGTVRRQLVFMMTGILLLLGLIISTIMIPVIFFQYDGGISLAPLYALIFIALTTIAILRYHLFDIKLIATEILVAIIVLTLLFEGLRTESLLSAAVKYLFSGLVLWLGYLLVKSVKKEIAQRIELANLNTTLKVSNEQLATANLRLKELDNQKTEFLSIASHQLRTPLSIINGYIELLADGGYGKMPTPALGVFANITNNTDHLIRLVNEFLDITHIEQGRAKFTFAPADVRDIVDEVTRELESQLKNKDLEIDWRRPERAVIATIDREKIRHVIFNFVDNAIKYSEHGAITITVKSEKGGVAVRVKDRGLGFGPVDQANFFQKFYRGKNVEGVNVTGTGLGLFVASKFVEGHQGNIWAVSPGPGRGSEFGFWVPLQHASEEVLAESSKANQKKKA